MNYPLLDKDERKSAIVDDENIEEYLRRKYREFKAVDEGFDNEFHVETLCKFAKGLSQLMVMKPSNARERLCFVNSAR